MENPWSRNEAGGGEDEENRQSINGSSAVNTDQFVEGVLRSSSSIDQSRERNNLNEINQPAAEAGPVGQQKSGERRQPTDLSSADSHHSKRNVPDEDTAADPLAKKRAYDRTYRERLKKNQKLTESKLETFEGENEFLKKENESLRRENETLSKELDELKKKYRKHQENEEEMMKSNLKTLEIENESLKTENETLSKELDELKNKYQKQQENEHKMKCNLETLETKNGKLKEKYKKQRESKKELRSNLKTANTEKRALMDRIFEYMLGNRSSETQSNELGQLKSKLENLENELASTKTSNRRQILTGSNTNFIVGFGQDLPNVETEGSRQSSQTTTMLPSSPAFHSGASSPTMGSHSPLSFCSFERKKSQ